MLSRLISLNARRSVSSVSESASSSSASAAAAAAAASAFRSRRGGVLRGVPASVPSQLFPGNAGGASHTAYFCFTAARGVQFEQTSETIGGINKRNKAQTTRWVTKSTKDYMQEADKKLKGNASVTNLGRERIKEDSVARRERIQELAEEGEAKFQLEMDRIRDDNSHRWKKGFNFFKRQGKAFFLLYLTVYVSTFVLLYVGFASGLIKKEAAFEFLLFFLGTYIDKEKFYKRIEAWNSYINVGFAFVINEFLEVLRLPFVMLLFYQCRPLLTGINQRVKKSIFRWNAAES